MTRVVCFGEMLLRLNAVGFERLFQSGTLEARFGGSEANVAINLSRFGVETAFVTRLPANAVGDAALRALRAEGIRTEHVLRGGPRVGIYFLEAGASQRPSTVVYDRAPSSMSTIDTMDIDWTQVLTGAAWLHVTGITPALSSSAAACTAVAMAAAREAGVTVSFDVNYRSMLWSVRDAAPVLQQFARKADVLIVSEDHLEPLLGIGSDTTAGQEVSERYGPSIVAVTSRDCRSASDNGVSATLWDARQRELHQAPRYEVRVVDRIGTGDAFAAGLIYGLTSGRSEADALRFAVAAGALKHTIPGDANLVSVADVDRVAGGDSSGRVQR